MPRPRLRPRVHPAVQPPAAPEEPRVAAGAAQEPSVPLPHLRQGVRNGVIAQDPQREGEDWEANQGIFGS